MVACGKSNGGTFVRCNHVMLRILVVGDVGANVLEQRIGNPGKKVYAVGAERIDKKLRADHDYFFIVPGMRFRICLIGMQ